MISNISGFSCRSFIRLFNRYYILFSFKLYILFKLTIFSHLSKHRIYQQEITIQLFYLKKKRNYILSKYEFCHSLVSCSSNWSVYISLPNNISRLNLVKTFCDILFEDKTFLRQEAPCQPDKVEHDHMNPWENVNYRINFLDGRK